MESRSAQSKYLVSLEAPENLRISLEALRLNWAQQGFLPVPLPPGIPLLETESPPPAPVCGRLPPCTAPLTFKKQPSFFSEEGLWVLGLEHPEWVRTLMAALQPSQAAGTPPASGHSPAAYVPRPAAASPPPARKAGLFPPGQGLPLALNAPDRPAPALPNLPRGWRAVQLVCYQLKLPQTGPWHSNIQWRELWKRRLRRAPGGKPQPNTDKQN